MRRSSDVISFVIGLVLVLLLLVLFLLAATSEARRESRGLALATAFALIASGAWHSLRNDNWWLFIAALVVGAAWGAFEVWKDRRAAPDPLPGAVD